jgi:signal transduction histidine kinase
MRPVRVVACLVGAAGVLVLVPVLRSPAGAPYDVVDPRLTVLQACAALALLLVAAASRPGVGATLLAGVGGLWLLPEVAGTSGVPLEVRTALDALSPVVAMMLLVALVLRADDSVRLGRPVRVAVTGAVVACLARLVLVDPFYQAGCWRTCEHNPLAGATTAAGGAVVLTGLGLLAIGVVWTAASTFVGSPARRGPTTIVDAAGWVAVVAMSGWLLAASGEAVLDAADDLSVALFLVVQVAVIAWPALVAWGLLRRWQLESRLDHLVDVLAGTSDPEMIANSLRTALKDPALRVCYWAPARQAFVDAHGRPGRGSAPGPEEKATTVRRHDQPIATIVHARRIDGQRLERALRPALRLALENAQLRAAALAELAELTSSRTRVVERSELERRRLERNLHDGAQQRVVSLALLIRIFAQHAVPADQAACRRAEVLARTLVEELRRVARGIYPAVLGDAGLVGGVEDLAERSDGLPVVLGDFPAARYSGAVETTAYLLVRAAIEDARSSGARSVTVSGADCGDALTVTVEDDAAVPPNGVDQQLDDQVGALGGTVSVAVGPRRRRLEVVLPCES